MTTPPPQRGTGLFLLRADSEKNLMNSVANREWPDILAH
jgi:hypothetical protein